MISVPYLQRISTYEEYKELTAEGKGLPCYQTNCYLLPADVKSKIAAGILYAARSDGIVAILEKREIVWQVYYYASTDLVKDASPIPLPIPSVAELVFNRDNSENILKETEILGKLGFRFGREVDRMRLDAEEAAVGDFKDVSIATESDVAGIEDLIAAAFDPYFAQINLSSRGFLWLHGLLESMSEPTIWAWNRE